MSQLFSVIDSFQAYSNSIKLQCARNEFIAKLQNIDNYQSTAPSSDEDNKPILSELIQQLQEFVQIDKENERLNSLLIQNQLLLNQQLQEDHEKNVRLNQTLKQLEQEESEVLNSIRLLESQKTYLLHQKQQQLQQQPSVSNNVANSSFFSNSNFPTPTPLNTSSQTPTSGNSYTHEDVVLQELKQQIDSSTTLLQGIQSLQGLTSVNVVAPGAFLRATYHTNTIVVVTCDENSAFIVTYVINLMIHIELHIYYIIYSLPLIHNVFDVVPRRFLLLFESVAETKLLHLLFHIFLYVYISLFYCRI